VGNSTTSDELEFLIPGEPILCKVGELHTTEVTFSQVLPKIQNLDSILAGNSFFLPPYLTGRIPEVPAHGQYSEDVICSIIQHFEDRYIFNTVSFILVALGLALIKTEELAANINHRFIGLSRQSKIRYCPGGNGSDDSTGICGGRGGPESMCTDHCYFKESTLMMTIFEQSLVRPVLLPGDRSEGAMF
ncbi:hypothetical protein PSHT_14687, partial [Puccinia striiformis]